MNYLTEDTICALATPPGVGGIGVIRVSGPLAFAVADRVLRHRKACSEYTGHTLHRADVMEPGTAEVIDDILVAVFHGPKSYTGEDVVELSCHGGPTVLRRTISALLASDARMAEPGEFTMRAFLNSQMDLAQAEAVCDIIRAQTDEAHKLALSQQAGTLSLSIGAIRDDLLGVLARIEAVIDFPEDVGDLDAAECKRSLTQSQLAIRSLLATADRGILYREGALVVLAGRPNVGKSSLMNALLRVSRAIVTPIPGTTRDVIEETLNIRGIPVRLADTAGLRETEDVAERMGVERTRRHVDDAALVLLVVDASAPIEDEDQQVIAGMQGRPMVVIENKSDIAFGIEPRIPGARRVSALTGEGVADLEDDIASNLLGADTPLDLSGATAIVTHARHRNALKLACEQVAHALVTLEDNMPPDFLAIDVRGAMSALEEIVGISTPDDIINEIFTRFCIGK